MFRKSTLLTASLLTLALYPTLSWGAVKLPAIISHNMILQKSAKTPIWGWADPGEKVTITLNGQTATATTGENKKWMAYLDLSKSAKGPFEMTVTGQNTLTIKNVLVGQVWVASGQSNMEFVVAGANNSQKEIAAADLPDIRQFHATYTTALTPQNDNDGFGAGWVVCSPQTAGGFSAVGFFFAREIHKELKTPVGLIHTSWGGTPAEAWTSEAGIATLPDFKNQLEVLHQLQAKVYTHLTPEAYKKAMDEWYRTAWPQDTDNAGLAKGWAKFDFDDSAWKTIKFPGAFEVASPDLKGFDGAIWFRKEFTLTPAEAQQDLTVNFGAIDDFDLTYLNGEKIGETNTDLENSWHTVREYTLPPKLLKAGKNVITVRIFDRGGAGGFCCEHPDPEFMQIYQNDLAICDLTGEWKYQIERQVPTVDLAALTANQPTMTPAYVPGQDAWAVSRLYNAMLHPFIPYGVAGAIWYQGEANAGQAYQYRTLFPTMITDWRTQWKKAGGQENLPFFFVQLANWQARDAQPRDSDWAELREAQQMTLALPDTGTALAIDLGEEKDIHPKNKQDVGHRLALNALAKVYGQKLEYSGPLFASKKIEGTKIRLTFTHAEGLRAGRDLPLEGASIPPLPVKGFAICGEDRKFVWANATIEGNSVIVSSPEVKNPTEVRYGWGINPEVNLYNGAGLPASPFRTDSFPGITQPKPSK